jgi:hypothetical protein
MGFDDDHNTSKLVVEICPDEYHASFELIQAIHDTLEYYKEHLADISIEIMKGPPVVLPALPAPKGGQDGENPSGG